MTQDKRTVSIDFGTSHSGFAFASKELSMQTIQPGQIMSFLNIKGTWPDATSSFYPKTRTAMLYDAATATISSWGNTASKKALDLTGGDDATKLYIDRVKLLLDETWAASDAGKNLLARLGRQPEDIIADYLLKIAETCVDELEALDGRKVQYKDIHWVLTVPAMWSPRSKAMMRDAMFRAKLITTLQSEDLILCLEPEAALLSVAFTSSEITAGDNILVLDCGGGTIDLSAFSMKKSTQEGGRNQFKFDELTRGRGVVKGSVVLDMEFEQHLASILGIEEWKVIRNDAGSWAKMLYEWENLKTRFEGSDLGNSEVSIPRAAFTALKRAGFKKVKDMLLDYNAAVLSNDECDIDNALVIPTRVLKQLFDNVVIDILAVTEEMLKDCATKGPQSRINKVVCVGGFCNNKYLVSSVRSMINAKYPGVQTVVPPSPGSAVLYGAALFGTSPSIVSSRVLRYTFGISAGMLWSHAHFGDVEQYNSYTDPRGNLRIRGGFSVFASKDQELEANKIISETFSVPSATTRTLTISVYLSESGAPKTIREPGCRLLGDIDIPVTPGEEYWNYDVEVKFHFGSSEISVSVRDSQSNMERQRSINYE